MSDTGKLTDEASEALEELGNEVRKLPLKVRSIGTDLFNIAEAILAMKAKDAAAIAALQAERDSFWQANLRLVAERERALTRVAELEAALPRAYEMRRDDAAVECRDDDDLMAILALTPPADLAERIKGEV